MFIRYRRHLFLMQYKFKHYSQFFNLQIHRLIIQPSLCMLLYIFLMRFRNKWTDARLSCKNLPSNEYTSFCTILKIFFSPIATDLQLRQEVHMKIWLSILIFFLNRIARTYIHVQTLNLAIAPWILCI